MIHRLRIAWIDARILWAELCARHHPLWQARREAKAEVCRLIGEKWSGE